MNARGILTAAYQVLHLYVLDQGTPIQPWTGGTPSLLGVSLARVPPSDLAGVPPHVKPGQGIPPIGPDWGIPIGPGQGYPLRPGWGVPPHPVMGYPLSKAGWRSSCKRLDGGTPWLDLTGVPSCGQTDRHVSKHNLPVILRVQLVKTEVHKFTQ